jgi:hypothetical protein
MARPQATATIVTRKYIHDEEDISDLLILLENLYPRKYDIYIKIIVYKSLYERVITPRLFILGRNFNENRKEMALQQLYDKLRGYEQGQFIYADCEITIG